ncbi:MAG: diguanylate cyclase domain-containing protein [Leptospirillia bacterium]
MEEESALSDSSFNSSSSQSPIPSSADLSVWLFQESPRNLFLLDSQGTLLVANASFLRTTGLPFPEIQGQPLRSWCQGAPDTLPSAHEKDVFSSLLIRKNGEPVVSEVSLEGCLLGESLFLLGEIRKISGNKTLEEEVTRLARYNHLLTTAASFVAEERPENELFSEVCDHLEDTGDFSLVLIVRPDENRDLRPVALAGAKSFKESLRPLFQKTDSWGFLLEREAFRSGGPLFVSDLSGRFRDVREDPWVQALMSAGCRSGSFFPLYRGGAPTAVMALYSRSLSAFDPPCDEILKTLAQMLSRALDRLDMRSRERDELLLRKLLLDHSPSGIALVREGALVYANAALVALFGHDRQQAMRGKDLESLWDSPGEARRVEEALSSLTPSDKTLMLSEVHARKADGSPLVLDLSLALAAYEGGGTVVLTANDATGRVRRFREKARLDSLREILSDLRREIVRDNAEESLLQVFCERLARRGEVEKAGLWEEASRSFGALSHTDMERAGGDAFPLRLSRRLSPDLEEGLSGCAREGIPRVFFWKEESSEKTSTDLESSGKGVNVALFPVPRGGQPWGVLTLFSLSPRAFAPESQEIFAGMAESLSLFLDRLDLRRSMRETAAFQEAILGHSRSGILIAEGRTITYVNPRMLEMFGYEKPEELLGEESRFLYRSEAEYHRVGELLFPAVLEGKPVLLQDVPGVRKDGTSLWVDIYEVLVQLGGKNLLIATLTDVTDRHIQAARLTMVARFRECLGEVRKLEEWVDDETSLLEKTAELFSGEGKFDSVSILRPDGHGGWVVEGERALPAPSEHSLFPPNSPLFQSLETGMAGWMSDPGKDDGLGSGVRGVVPILRKGRPCFALLLSGSDPDLLASEIREVVEEAGRSLSRALDRRDQEVRERALSSLNRAITENASVGFILVDLQEGRLLYVNPYHLEELGYAPDFSVQGRLFRLFLADDEELRHVNEALESAQREGRESVSLVNVRLRRRDGAVFLFDLFGRWIEHEGSPRFLWTAVNVTERNRLQRRIEYEATHDSLTDLPNRRAMESYLEMAIARSRRNGGSLVTGLIDLDDFKPVNDLYGHEAGDRLLREFSKRVRRCLRESDFFCRLGGDEFVIVLEFAGRDSEKVHQELVAALDRLHSAVETSFDVGEGRLARVGMTLGVARLSEETETVDALLRKADLAMYALKSWKGERRRWWGERREVPDLVEQPKAVAEEFSAFGSEAQELLGRVFLLVERATRRFVLEFYDHLGKDPGSREILERMDESRLERLRKSQEHHLTFLLSPGTTSNDLWRRSRALGEAHVFYGVDLSALVYAKVVYGKLLTAMIRDFRLSAMEQMRLHLVIEERLGLDIRYQSESESRVQGEFRDYLFRPLFPVVGEKGQAEDVGALSQLSGISGASLVAFGEDGRVEVMAGSEEFSEAVSRQRELFLMARESRSFQLVENAELPDGVTRSLAVLPIFPPPVDPGDFTPLPPPVTIVVGGCYPGQFGTPWLRNFLTALGWRWGSVMAGVGRGRSS